MFFKLLILVVNIIVILVLSPTFIYSAPLVIQDIGNFYCPNGTNPNLYCCPLLAHRTSSSSKSVILTNKSGYKMNLVAANLENGQWIKGYNINCEPQTNPLTNGQSEAFSSSESSGYYNMQGMVTFVIDDVISSTFTISWKTSSPVKYYYLSGKKYNIEVHSIYDENDVAYQQVTVHNCEGWGTPFQVLGILAIMIVFMFTIAWCSAAERPMLSSRRFSQRTYYNST